MPETTVRGVPAESVPETEINFNDIEKTPFFYSRKMAFLGFVPPSYFYAISIMAALSSTGIALVEIADSSLFVLGSYVAKKIFIATTINIHINSVKPTK